MSAGHPEDRDERPSEDAPGADDGPTTPGPASEFAAERAPDAGPAPTGELRPAQGQSHGSAEKSAEAEKPTEPAARSRRGRRRAEKARKPKRKAPWWELPALIVIAVLVAIGVKSFVIQPFYIPSGSMEHTLHGCPGCSGDRILVNKTVYDFRDPEAGDIVVFNRPGDWGDADEPTSRPPGNPVLKAIRGFGQLIGFVPPDGEVLVKRVIATGGQTVKGDAQGHVMVSDDGPHGHFRTLVEPYVYINKNEGGLFDFGPVTVPKGRLWVMGDHRSDSADSRYHCGAGEETDDATSCNATVSTVPDGDVIGKAIVIAWPPSRWRTLGTPKTFDSASAVTAGGMPLVAVVPVFLWRRRRRRKLPERSSGGVAGPT